MKQNIITSTPIASKRPSVILGTIVIWFAILFIVIWHWTHQFGPLEFPFSILVIINFGIWWIALLWGLHHSNFQILALFKKSNQKEYSANTPRIAILYVTKDDFDANCCKSCFTQEYPNAQVYICDDSETSKYKKIVDAFKTANPSCKIVRRKIHTGFKAGNLNHAINNLDDEKWILLVDADQFLPRKYLKNLVKRIPENHKNVAFIQGAHEPKVNNNNNFQLALSPEIELFYKRSFSVRDKFGFVTLLGHGALVQKSAWERFGPFPEIVSEDFAFSLNVASNNHHGIYIEDVASFEEYPNDFGGFLIRLKKWSGGTAELLKWSNKSFWCGTSSLVERWDFAMQIFGYILTPFIFANGFLGLFVLHKLWNEYTVRSLNPTLPYLFTFLFLTTITIIISVSKNIWEAIRFYFWATAIYAASLPIIGWTFIKHIFLPPTFHRTPKNGERTPLKFWISILMVILGCITISASIYWYSLYTYVLAGVGTAYLFFPLFGHLTSSNPMGVIARILIWLPGGIMLYALYAMWAFGSF